MTPSVCIIGAGSSGIAACKILYERHIPFDCYEKSSGIGGNWRYGNDNGMSSIYASLRINTSKTRMSYADFPMPKDYPDFPDHTQVLRYFENYVDHFGFRDKITLNTGISKIIPIENRYRVFLDNGLSKDYDTVLVANGHHWDPNIPKFAGEFTGTVLHSHEYKIPEPMRGKNVLVVGIGNSGVDIACETSAIANQTFLTTRRSAHVVPRYLFGRPTDLWIMPIMAKIPLSVQRFAMQTALTLARGKQESYGLPTPQHPVLAEHVTVSSDLLKLVGSGKIKVKPDIECLMGDRVRFVDGSTEQIDVLIMATGYKVTFPFFEPDFIEAKQNYLPLYKNVVDVNHPGIYFIGLIQPLGAVMPLAEIQSKWIAGLIKGEYALPSKADMLHEITERYNRLKAQFVASPRHTLEVEFFAYRESIRQEMRKRREPTVAKGLPNPNQT